MKSRCRSGEQLGHGRCAATERYRLEFDFGQLCKVRREEMLHRTQPIVPHSRGADRVRAARIRSEMLLTACSGWVTTTKGYSVAWLMNVKSLIG